MKGYFITCIDRCVFRVSRVCQALLPSVIGNLQQISQVQWVRRYASKDIRFGVEACALMLQGVEQLADAVQVTMGSKVHNSMFCNCYVCFLCCQGILLVCEHSENV